MQDPKIRQLYLTVLKIPDTAGEAVGGGIIYNGGHPLLTFLMTHPHKGGGYINLLFTPN